MVRKRGKIATVGILAAITLASFAVWLIPQNTGTVLVTTDHGDLLDATVAIHDTLRESLDEQYGLMLQGTVSSGEYAEAAGIVSDQVTGQIRTLASAEPPSEWVESYSQYIESLRAFNSMIRETAVVAEAISSGEDISRMESRIAELRALSAEHAGLSDTARP